MAVRVWRFPLDDEIAAPSMIEPRAAPTPPDFAATNDIHPPLLMIKMIRLALWFAAQALVFFSALALPLVLYTEARWQNLALFIASMLFLFGLLRLLWLGPMLSGVLSFSAMMSIYGASKFKFWLTGRVLNAWDMYNYLHLNTLLYVRDLYPKQYLYVYASLAALFLLAIAVFCFERFKRPSLLNVATFVLLLLYGSIASDRGLFADAQHPSTFILSSIESVPQFVAGHVFEYGDAMPLDPQQVAVARNNRCTPPSGTIYPNVIVVFRESIVIPSTVPGMGVPQVDESRFASSDGRTHRLRVETFGGGSARTIFSLLTGISVQSFFGGMKNIAMDLTPGKLRYSLPFLMRDCGFRTTAITTGGNGYVASEEFYRSIGFQDYFDLHDITRRTAGDISDRGIYGFLSEVLATNSVGSPIFAFVDTIASHAPYTYALRIEETVPEADPIKDPIISEYVRRLVIGERDLDKFIEHYSSVSHRPLVVLDFGDHQPYFTKDLPGHSGYVNEDRDQDDPHMFTYFRVRSTGRALAELPANHPIVDVAFVSDWLVHALDLPIEGIYNIRWPIVERCKSRYWRCEGHAAAYELHQILRAADLMSYP
jgi:phosphoglycerol transferase MdoB-like AlkP superfamily enzyme